MSSWPIAAALIFFFIGNIATTHAAAESGDALAEALTQLTTSNFKEKERAAIALASIRHPGTRRALEALLKGPGDEEAKKEIAALELVEQHYTTEEERRLHAAASGPDYGEPVPMDMSNKEPDSVTLF